MVSPYQTPEDAAQHLNHTIIMYDDRPVYVQEVFRAGGVIRLSLLPVPSLRDPFAVDLFDPLIDAKIMGQRLGYCNLGSGLGATWVSRIPARQYHQGLCGQNLSIGNVNGRGNVLRWDSLMRRAEFADMLRRQYPSYKEVLKQLENDHDIPSIAFHPHLAIERQELGYYLLLYKAERVAWGDPLQFKLPKKFEYLKETLNKCGVPYVA